MDFFTSFPYFFTMTLAVLALRAGTPAARGRRGERRVGRKLRALRKEGYTIFHDIMVRRSDGRTSQIDHIAVGPAGVFVIETKNRRGEIVGNDHEKKWHAGKSLFQNPVHQNRTHISALREILGDDTMNFVSMVVFPDRTDLRKVAPYGVFTMSEMVPEILLQPSLFPEECVRKTADAVRDANITSRKVRREHVRTIRRRLRHDRLCLKFHRCPECGKRLSSYRRNDMKEYVCMHCGYDTLRTGRSPHGK